MTIPELIAQIRIIIDDTVQPYMVSDEDIVFAIDSSQSDFAEQTYCLFSGADLTVEATENSPWVTLPSNVLGVRALVNADGSYIRPVTTVEMDFGHFSSSGLAIRQDTWRALSGTPKFAVTDQSKDKLRLVPKPSADVTLTLEAYMLPTKIDDAADLLEIPSEYHSDLIAGAAKILYGTQNVEIFDPNKSQEWAIKWQMALDVAKEQLDTARRVVIRNFRLPRTMEYRNAQRVQAESPTQQSQ